MYTLEQEELIDGELSGYWEDDDEVELAFDEYFHSLHGDIYVVDGWVSSAKVYKDLKKSEYIKQLLSWLKSKDSTFVRVKHKYFKKADIDMLFLEDWYMVVDSEGDCLDLTKELSLAEGVHKKHSGSTLLTLTDGEFIQL